MPSTPAVLDGSIRHGQAVLGSRPLRLARPNEGASIARDLNAALNASYDALRGRSLAPSARSGGSGEGPDLDFLNSLSYDLSCDRKQR